MHDAIGKRGPRHTPAGGALRARVPAVAAAMVAVGCASRSVPPLPPATCPATVINRWLAGTPDDPRVLRVWIDEASQEFDGWSAYGRRRLRVATDRWNALRLPVRFEIATAARNAEIVVNVVDTLPAHQQERATEQAGLTQLTFTATRVILKAHVFVAVRARFGIRFRIPEQQATLLHELGHALGLPHATGPKSLMSERRFGATLTGTDIVLARSVYPPAPCAASPVSAVPARTPGRAASAITVTGDGYARGLQWANVTLYRTETSLQQDPAGRLSREESRTSIHAERRHPVGGGADAGGMFDRPPDHRRPRVLRAAHSAEVGFGLR